MRGITWLLEKAFWPSYDFRKATKDIGTPASKEGPKTSRGGMRRGNEVDFQIRALVNDGEAVRHPFARKLLKALELQGLKPYRAQVRVEDEESGLFTGVDLLCKKGANQYIIVEIKCGFSRAGVYDASNGKMRGCLHDVSNSPRHQHAVQTAVTRYLFCKTFPELPAPEALVARVSDDGVHMHKIPAEFISKAKAIVQTISRLTQTRIQVRKRKPSKNKSGAPERNTKNHGRNAAGRHFARRG